MLSGMAGAIVPLLRLSELTGDPRWRQEAVRIGDRLADLARPAPPGYVGPAHGPPTGSAGSPTAPSVSPGRWPGWPTPPARSGSRRWPRRASSSRTRSTTPPPAPGRIRVKEPGTFAHNWVYGSDGIAVVASDLSPDRFPHRHDLLRRAAAATWAGSFGRTHTLCHGDLGAWEAMDRAVTAGVAPPHLTRDALDARVVSSLTEFGPPHWAVTSTMFRPGLLAGAGGIAYQLLRMDRDSALPSLLLPDPAA